MIRTLTLFLLLLLFINFQCNSVVDGNVEEVPSKKVIKFNPPLYKQRYQFVKNLVEQHQPKKVGISLSRYLLIMPSVMLCRIKIS